MTYTALYRRYRPQQFSQLVGQPQISRVLSYAVKSGNLVHAYLFAGPRGTGKTSAARILARAVNCTDLQENGEPCGTCDACRRILDGDSMDVIEIDGASNRGIDEIRDLRERVKYAPAQEKRKVYIIDEVHMLTNDAFNALLKTLEEPPSHVMFILATTAPHKLLATVLSRCQRFDFRRISDADIQQHLANIAAAEGVAAEEDALALIARKAEGGMRDAVSLLDQCSGVCQGTGAGKIDRSLVETLLGTVDRNFIHSLLHALLRHDTAEALSMTDQLVASGRDLRQALDDLLSACRDLLLAMIGRSTIPEWAKAFQPKDLLHILQALSDTDGKMRTAMSPRITFELALIRAGGLPEGTAAASAPAAAPAPTSAKAVAAAAKVGDIRPAPSLHSARAVAEDDTPPWDVDDAPVPTSAKAAAAAAKVGDIRPAPSLHSARAVAEDDTPPWDVDDVDDAPVPTSAKTVAAASAAPQPAAAPLRPSPMEKRRQSAPQQRKAAASTPLSQPEPEDASVSEGAAIGIEEIRALWPGILEKVDARNQGAAAILQTAIPKEIQGTRLILDFPPSQSFSMKSIMDPGMYRPLVENMIRSATHKNLTVSGVIGEEREFVPEPAADDAPPPTEADIPPEVEQGSIFS